MKPIYLSGKLIIIADNVFDISSRDIFMEILFSCSRVEKLFTDGKTLKRKHPDVSSDVVKRRLEQMRLVSNLQDLHYILAVPPLKLHKLQTDGDIFAIWVSAKKRLLLEPNPDKLSQPVRQADLKDIQSVILLDIGDYH